MQDDGVTNKTRLHLHFKGNNEEKEFKTVFVCEDYGNIPDLIFHFFQFLKNEQLL